MYELYDPCTVMFFYRNKVCASPWPPPPRRGRSRAPFVAVRLCRESGLPAPPSDAPRSPTVVAVAPPCCTHRSRSPHTLRLCPAQHIMIDLGTGNNNKINWAIHDKQALRPTQPPRPSLSFLARAAARSSRRTVKFPSPPPRCRRRPCRHALPPSPSALKAPSPHLSRAQRASPLRIFSTADPSVAWLPSSRARAAAT